MKRLTRDKLASVLGQYVEPRLTVAPGETFLVETEDCYSGTLRSPADVNPVSRERGGVGFSNPVTGPVYVEGAMPGDALVVNIHDIRCLSPGVTRVRPKSGVVHGVVGSTQVMFIEIDGAHAYLPGGYTLPLNPMIGTIGVAPYMEAVPTVVPGSHGGNLDFKDVGPGAQLILPVSVPGALLFMGDVHATQGDGEVSGAAVECQAEVTASVELCSPAPASMRGIRVKRGGTISTVASDKPLDDAVRACVAAMIEWLVEEWGMDRAEAYFLMSNSANVRVAQMVNPIYTAVCTIREPGK
jgi:amidase